MWAGDLLRGVNAPKMQWCEPDRAPEEGGGRKADDLMWGGKSTTSVLVLVTAWQAEQSASWYSFALEKLYLAVQLCPQTIRVSEAGKRMESCTGCAKSPEQPLLAECWSLQFALQPWPCLGYVVHATTLVWSYSWDLHPRSSPRCFLWLLHLYPPLSSPR